METGDRAAGHRGEQDREYILDSVAVVDRKTGESRECIHIGVRSDDTDRSDTKHRIEQERA